MIRAALGLMIVGVILIGWTALWIWLYRQAADVAPEWMIRVEGRGGSLLEKVAVGGYIFSGGILFVICRSALFKVLRIPPEALEVEAEHIDYPFNRRKPSSRALGQPGQAGFVDAKLKQFDAFAKEPLNPPRRTDDPN